MKKFATAILIVFLWASFALAAGTCTQGKVVQAGRSGNMWTLDIVCTADASNGSYPTVTINSENDSWLRGKHLLAFKVKWGTTAPTTGMSMTVKGDMGDDFLGGEGSSMSTTTPFATYSYLGGKAYGPAPIDSALILTPTGNSINSATFTARYIIIE